MKHIKTYNIFESQEELEHPGFPTTEEEIHRLCKKYDITNYTINKDLSIDVEDNVLISTMDLDFIPLNFNYVNGDFYCHNNNLKTLEGGPKYVQGEYHCDGNQLKNLKGSPKETRDLYCADNKLTSLEGMPNLIKGVFDCSINRLKTFNPSGVINGQIFLFNNIITVLMYILIYEENRNELINEFNHYRITDGEVVYKERLEMFCGDFDLQMPNMELVKQSYKIV